MRKHLFILLLLGVITVSSCHKEPVPGGELSGYGSIELSLGSSDAIRLATKTDADLLEGLRFNNVLVILVDNSGKVIGNVYKTYPYTNGGGSDIQDSEVATSVTEDVIHFEHLLPGDYHVYAYANINATEWQKTGEDLIADQEKAVAAGNSFSGYLDRELLSLTSAGTDVPADPSTSMLLTGHKTIPVGLSVVNDTLDLIRPLVRFKVTVRNHTRFPVNVDELRFSHFNPDKAYLLDHRDASGVPEIPAGVTYRALPAFDPSAPEATVAAESEGVVYQTLLYENASTETYKIFSTLRLNRSLESLSDLTLSMGARPFGLIDYETISTMADGEKVDVLVINPRSATRSGRLYYGIGDTGIAWESCGYNSYAGFFARAQAIYNEVDSYNYSGTGLWNGFTGAANNKSGLAGWTGNSADAPYKGDTFDYTGANHGTPRKKYFRTLTKTGELFSIDGLSTNPPSETSITGIRIEQGTATSGKFPSDIKSNQLVTFIQNSTGKHLKSDCKWNDSSDNGAKDSKVIWDSVNNQDHQFILFGEYCSGGLLKRLLKENNKEVPLTYMARNEEVNVVINVYYADQSGEITFTVDNTHWTDAGATTSTHTFN